MSHAKAERYARALRIAMAVRHPRRGEMDTLARRCGYSRVHLSQVMRGARIPTERFLTQACSALGVSRELLEVLAGEGCTGDPLTDFLRGTWA